MAGSGSLVTRQYANFKGVDFTGENTAEYRSPDSLNMWKNYKTLAKRIETRPDIESQLTLDNTIFGLFFYTINNVDHWIIHTGTKLIDYNPNTEVETIIKASGMNPRKSIMFIYNNILFIKDGINYLEYNGTTLSNVVGTIPLTSIARTPSGGGTQYQSVNLLSDFRQNNFIGDGTSTEYYLDTQNISNDGVRVWIDDVLQNSNTYTINTTGGYITFNTAPGEAETPNVLIEFKKQVSGSADKIKKCNLACIFDNRIFFSGNIDYPNSIFWTERDDPRYISDISYIMDGDIAQIKAIVPGNNALWAFKERGQGTTTIFYHTPIDVADDFGNIAKKYPSMHSSIATGCKSTGINFNDDIVFFSDKGMEGISGDITTEQVVKHRSTLVDSKLLNEANYDNMTLIEWESYLLVIIDNKIYLADYNQKVNNIDHIEYEWYYWELSDKIKVAQVHDGVLYLCGEESTVDGVTTAKIYTLTNNNANRTISSYWTTTKDDFKYPNMLKTTNKRGFKADVSGNSIVIDVKTDNGNFENLGTYTNTKGYIVAKLKKKKWNSLQLKFSSTKPFGIYDVVLESYIGSYVKRS